VDYCTSEGNQANPESLSETADVQRPHLKQFPLHKKKARVHEQWFHVDTLILRFPSAQCNAHSELGLLTKHPNLPLANSTKKADLAKARYLMCMTPCGRYKDHPKVRKECGGKTADASRIL
jgi:hypothetical protein